MQSRLASSANTMSFKCALIVHACICYNIDIDIGPYLYITYLYITLYITIRWIRRHHWGKLLTGDQLDKLNGLLWPPPPNLINLIYVLIRHGWATSNILSGKMASHACVVHKWWSDSELHFLVQAIIDNISSIAYSFHIMAECNLMALVQTLIKSSNVKCWSYRIISYYRILYYTSGTKSFFTGIIHTGTLLLRWITFNLSVDM